MPFEDINISPYLLFCLESKSTAMLADGGVTRRWERSQVALHFVLWYLLMMGDSQPEASGGSLPFFGTRSKCPRRRQHGLQLTKQGTVACGPGDKVVIHLKCYIIIYIAAAAI